MRIPTTGINANRPSAAGFDVWLACALALAGVLAASPAEAQPKPPTAPSVDLNEMVELSGATFQMGVPYREPSDYGDSWFVDQMPQTNVKVDPFYIDEHEVTVREFALFLTYAGGPHHYNADQPIDPVAAGYRPTPGTANQPIRQITWWAARDYCRWAGGRLPTEAEWEYAATGGNDRTYPWGDDGASCRQAVHFTGRAFCEEGPRPVGKRPGGATESGIHDLGGNVAEWVSDWYGPYPETDDVRQNPTGPESGQYKVTRGGGFLDGGQFMRAAARRAAPPGGTARDVGFRCVIEKDAVDQIDGSRRGSLRLPPDRDREPSNRFPAPEVDRPETLADGIFNPGGITQFGGDVYVVDRQAGALVEIAPGSGETSEVVSDKSGLTDVTAGANRLYATDAEANEIYEIVPGMPAETVATTDTEPGPIAARGSTVVWGETDRVVAYDASSESTTVLDGDVQNAVSVALSSSDAFYAADGDGNYSNMEVASVPLSGGSPTVLFDAPNRRGDFWVPSITFSPDNRSAYFVLRRSGFPRQGYLHRASAGSAGANELTYTPPNPSVIDAADGRLYWATQRSLVSFTPILDPTFALPARMTRIAALDADSNYIVWADTHTGRIHRIEP